MLRYTYEVVVSVPEHWTEDDIDFHRNESSWCANNSLQELDKRKEEHCWCSAHKSEFVREATNEDESAWDSVGCKHLNLHSGD